MAQKKMKNNDSFFRRTCPLKVSLVGWAVVHLRTAATNSLVDQVSGKTVCWETGVKKRVETRP